MFKSIALFAALALSAAVSACAPMHVDKQPSAANAGKAPCIIVGCSSQLCVANTENNQGLVSTCEFKPTYACYPKFGKCKQQADGQCGWTKTAQLDACLSNPALAKQK